jgi:hypothetical protein
MPFCVLYITATGRQHINLAESPLKSLRFLANAVTWSWGPNPIGRAKHIRHALCGQPKSVASVLQTAAKNISEADEAVAISEAD